MDHGPGSVPVMTSGVRSSSSACFLLSAEGITCQMTSEGPLRAVSRWPSARDTATHLYKLPRCSVPAGGISSAGHDGHRGFVWCRIALKTVIAGPDVPELFLVNWNNKLIRTVCFPILSSVEMLFHTYIMAKSMHLRLDGQG